MISFADAFKALTGYEPLGWQKRLYDEWFSRGRVPSVCTLPTGLGKTSVIPIWLIALARLASERGDGPRLPRRLVYIVNRRTVVDQATDIVVKMRERLLSPDEAGWRAHARTLRALAESLHRLGDADDHELPLAVSTLRGELADNEEWKVNPARPAIIIGTIDMIGSKLLFSGYGDGRYKRAHHAGLIGQDTLIVHDEAHLTPAFSALLNAIETEQQREQARNGRPAQVSRPIKVMELSATTRSNGLATVSGERGVFGIGAGDGDDPVVQARLTARKCLSLTPAEADGLTARIVQAAFEHEGTGCRVLVYVRSPVQALEVQNTIVTKIVEKLRHAGVRMSKEEAERAARQRVGLLTGTIRGYERDLLVESDLFKEFKADVQRPPQLEQTLYLVSTSAGEVGVDLDAEHLVCDLTTLDSMIQRFGRVNRLGVDRDGRPRAATITVVVEQSDDKDPLREQVQKTAEVLRRLPQMGDAHNASPQALDALLRSSDAQAAFAPRPQVRPVSDILLDNWSLTSVAGEMPGRPQVAEYLHGVAEWEPAETFVAWRAEVSHLARADVDHEALAEWFEACPILAHERLRDRTDRVRAALDKLLKNRRKKPEDANFDVTAVLLNERGEARFVPVSELASRPNGRDPLAYATVVLPTEIGGLNESGTLDATAEPREHLDVAEETPGGLAARGGPPRRERWLCVRDADGERWKHLLSGQEAEQPPGHLRERERVTLREPPEGAEDEGQTEELVLLSERTQVGADSPEHVRFAEKLPRHSERVAAHAGRIAAALNLPQALREAVVLAARWHDRGKDRPVWQRYARNRNPADPLAKSDRYGHWRELAGYRHEFGSLLEAAAAPEIRDHPERELILHLIAAHHGWARPHFEQAAQDNEGPVDPATGQRRRPTTRENEAVAIEAMQRFGRLQLRFGRWGLAWLESLLRCADALASAAPQAAGAGDATVDADGISAAQEGTRVTSTGGTTPDAGSEGRL